MVLYITADKSLKLQIIERERGLTRAESAREEVWLHYRIGRKFKLDWAIVWSDTTIWNVKSSIAALWLSTYIDLSRVNSIHRKLIRVSSLSHEYENKDREWKILENPRFLSSSQYCSINERVKSMQ